MPVGYCSMGNKCLDVLKIVDNWAKMLITGGTYDNKLAHMLTDDMKWGIISHVRGGCLAC